MTMATAVQSDFTCHHSTVVSYASMDKGSCVTVQWVPAHGSDRFHSQPSLLLQSVPGTPKPRPRNKIIEVGGVGVMARVGAIAGVGVVARVEAMARVGFDG